MSSQKTMSEQGARVAIREQLINLARKKAAYSGWKGEPNLDHLVDACVDGIVNLTMNFGNMSMVVKKTSEEIRDLKVDLEALRRTIVGNKVA